MIFTIGVLILAAILFASDAKDTIEWLATYGVAMLSRGALRSLTILLAPLEGKVDEPKPRAVIGLPSELSLAPTGVIACSVTHMQKTFITHTFLVKMAGKWPRSLFCPVTSSRSKRTKMRHLANIPLYYPLIYFRGSIIDINQCNCSISSPIFFRYWTRRDVQNHPYEDIFYLQTRSFPCCFSQGFSLKQRQKVTRNQRSIDLLLQFSNGCED